MRRLFAVASAALTVGTLAVADAEGDMAACADKKSPDANPTERNAAFDAVVGGRRTDSPEIRM